MYKKIKHFFLENLIKLDKSKLKRPQKNHSLAGKIAKKADSGAYNKWFMPANQRFFNKIEDKIMESKKSPLFNNGNLFYN